MGDPLADPRSCVENAKRHIDDFKRETASYVATKPYAAAVEPDPDTSEDVHKIKLTKPLPLLLRHMALDTLNNLRAALDHAGHAVAVAAGTAGKRAHFPFADSAAEVESRRNGGSKDLPKEIFDVMASLQPYKGGNDFLWSLNKLRNTEEHEIVIPVVLYTGGSYIGEMAFGSVNRMTWPPVWDTARNEMVFARTPHGTQFHYDFTLALYIALGQIKGLQPFPATNIFDRMTGEVERCLTTIEAEARRIGLFP